MCVSVQNKVGVDSQVQSEFARLQEQLSGVEQYAMRYLESERAHIISQELRLAQVHTHTHTHCHVTIFFLTGEHRVG